MPPARRSSGSAHGPRHHQNRYVRLHKAVSRSARCSCLAAEHRCRHVSGLVPPTDRGLASGRERDVPDESGHTRGTGETSCANRESSPRSSQPRPFCSPRRRRLALSSTAPPTPRVGSPTSAGCKSVDGRVVRLLHRHAGRTERRTHRRALHGFLHQRRRRSRRLRARDWRISFDADQDENSTYYMADHFVMHPDWLAPRPGRAAATRSTRSSRRAWRTSRWSTSARTSTASSAGADGRRGLLGGHRPEPRRRSRWSGYGTDEYITGSAASPKAITVYDGARSYRDVSVITTHDLLPDRFLKITAGVCFGDSGGPLFHDGTVVALNTWTFS